MVDATHTEDLSLSVKDFEHSFDKFVCIFHVEPIGEPDMMFLTHPISFFSSINFLNIGFSCTSWSHTRNVIPVPTPWLPTDGLESGSIVSRACRWGRSMWNTSGKLNFYLQINSIWESPVCLRFWRFFFQCPFFFFFLSEYQLHTGFWRVGWAWTKGGPGTLWILEGGPGMN